ncbi:EamA/RhaT family transporter [Fibrella sp. WM1]|uniref:EamA/RhaT family transporter n=1 Tax=Fibrella musci TaxID=3242485 RepID=UPI00351FBA97
MVYLIASVVLSVLLLLNFRLFPRYQVDTFQAIVFNYPVCFVTGYLLLPAGVDFQIDLTQTWTWIALGIGVAFVLTFLLSGASTQRNGMTATSLANNLSLVIPVSVSLFVLARSGTSGSGGARAFDAWNYVGLVLAVVAVGLSTYRKPEPAEAGSGTLGKAGQSALLLLSVFLMYGFTNTMINYMNVRYIAANASTTGLHPVVVTLTMVVGAIAAGFFLLLIRYARGGERLAGRNVVGALTLGIPNFLSFYTLVLALSAYGGNGAFVYPLYNIGVILLAAATATLFFRERLLTINKIGLTLAVMAIALLSWQEFV